MPETGIDYADFSWGPWRGCRKVAIGCLHCYAEREMKRYGRDHSKIERAKDNTFYAPVKKTRKGEWKWPSGSRVFVCPWSDFFIGNILPEWRHDAWNVMHKRPDLTFIIPTKRVDLIETHEDTSNIILLASCSTQDDVAREAPKLLNIDRRVYPVRGLSLEPLIGAVDVNLYLPIRTGRFYSDLDALCRRAQIDRITGRKSGGINGLDWVVIGCESGKDRRPCKLEWIVSIVRQCQAAGVPVYVKQVPLPKTYTGPGVTSTMMIRQLDRYNEEHGWRVSHDPNEWPESIRVREFPHV